MNRRYDSKYPAPLSSCNVVLALLLLSSCGPGPVDPAATGGAWLDTPADLSCSHRPAFDPQRDWLVYWLEGTWADEVAPIQPPRLTLALLEWRSRRSLQPQGLPPASSLTGTLCWDEDARHLYARAVTPPDFMNTQWYRLDLARPGSWVAGGGPPQQCVASPDLQWEWHSHESHTPAIERGLEIIQLADTEVLLRLDGDVELARHSTRHFGASHIDVSRYAWSADGQRLAYTLSESRGSWSAGATRTHLLNRNDGSIEVLGSGLYALQWRGSQELVACARRPGSGHFGLVVWRWP